MPTLENDPAPGTGYIFVDSDVFCVLTRFRVRSLWSLAKLYRYYGRVKSETARTRIPGLLNSFFLVEDSLTCYTLSFWSNPQAIGEFNTRIRTHIEGANASIQYLAVDGGRAQLWSSQLRLEAISPHNMQWDGLRLEEHFRLRERGQNNSQDGLSNAP